MKAVTSSLLFPFNMLYLTTNEIIKSRKKNSRHTENLRKQKAEFKIFFVDSGKFIFITLLLSLLISFVTSNAKLIFDIRAIENL